MLSTDQKGSIAEMAIAYAAIKLHIGVFKPLNDGERYDLIFDLRPALVRVQCKWAVRRGSVVEVRCYSCRRGKNGMIRRGYSPWEIDAFAVYCADLDTCYFLPIREVSPQQRIYLRLEPSQNNQRRRIKWAEDFRFEARLGDSGAVAQLGERQSGTLEVTGSSPVGSTFDDDPSGHL